MSGVDRRRYLSSPVLDQALLNDCADNFETKIEMIVDIETPDGDTIRASDRNKYVGGIFYEALTDFPVTSRTVGEWLSPTLQFSTVSLTLSNADGRFSRYLPGGADYDAFTGKTITVSIGLAETASTYKPIFQGTITTVGGVSRGRFSINFIARDQYEKLNVAFPKLSMTRQTPGYADLEEGNIGKVLPLIYGDWTTALEPDLASIPAFVINGGSPLVDGGVTDPPDPTRSKLKLVVSENANRGLDTTNVYLFKNDAFIKVPTSAITGLNAQNNYFEIAQGGAWLPDSEAYLYSQGDQFFVRVLGKDLGSYSDNPVSQAMDILITQGGAFVSDFDINWYQYRDKASPPQSAIALIKSRVWANEQQPAMEYALSMLEQIRLEAFVSKDLKLKINSLHFEDFVASPNYEVSNWDVIEDSLEVAIDDQHNFNRAQAVYDYRPNRNEESRSSRFARNEAAIVQFGQTVSKRLLYPNLFNQTDVENQLVETLKISSSLFETVTCSLTWRALLLDISDYVSLNVSIGSILYQSIPCMIRNKGYDPQGIKIPVTLWSLMLLPFPGFEPGYAGTVGGFDANISFE